MLRLSNTQRAGGEAVIAIALGTGWREGYRVAFFSEFWLYLKTRKKFWLLPILIVMGVFGGLVAATKGSAVAPFIYALF
jgi:hypothetical protein